jgi:SAM-dependent methyltransferase
VSDGPVAGSLRRLARAVPAPLRDRAKELGNQIETVLARRLYESAAAERTPLRVDALDDLARRYPVGDIHYNYAPEDRLARGVARRAAIEPYAPSPGASLEIGSADAMTSAELASAGWRATAIDIDVSRTDPRARDAGVAVHEMDATRLLFPDASFDLVFTFNVFEHLPDPAATFAEIVRVLKPGGVAYISFTGLRWSPHGAHMYKVTNVPYITVLFDEADVLGYLRAHGLPDRFPWVNEYSIEHFREVFHGHAGALETVHYTETWNRWHTRLIAAHPGIFKARAPSFDSLLVDSVHATFRRRPAG